MLVTLEDFVSRRGFEWRFDGETIKIAGERSIYFDQTAGGTRYALSSSG
jgi:hypothetical protein